MRCAALRAGWARSLHRPVRQCERAGVIAPVVSEPRRVVGSAGATGGEIAEPVADLLETGLTDEDAVDWSSQLADEVSRLPPRQASVIRLTYLHRETISEAAAWLGVETAEAQRLLAEALQRLGTALGPRP